MTAAGIGPRHAARALERAHRAQAISARAEAALANGQRRPQKERTSSMTMAVIRGSFLGGVGLEARDTGT